MSSRLGRSTRTSHWYAQRGRGSLLGLVLVALALQRALLRRSRGIGIGGVLPRVLVGCQRVSEMSADQALGGDQLPGDPLGLAGLLARSART